MFAESVVVVCMLLAFSGKGHAESQPALGRLYTDLFKNQNYEKNVQPYGSALKVGIYFSCARYDKTQDLVTTTVTEIYEWTDRRLVWDPEQYGNIKVMRLESDQVWIPDVTMMNVVQGEQIRDLTRVVIKSNGTLTWYPLVHHQTLCEHDATTFYCHYYLGQWTNDVASMPMTIFADEPAEKYYFDEVCPLKIQSVTSTLSSCVFPKFEHPYEYAVFNVTYHV